MLENPNSWITSWLKYPYPKSKQLTRRKKERKNNGMNKNNICQKYLLHMPISVRNHYTYKK